MLITLICLFRTNFLHHIKENCKEKELSDTENKDPKKESILIWDAWIRYVNIWFYVAQACSDTLPDLWSNSFPTYGIITSLSYIELDRPKFVWKKRPELRKITELSIPIGKNRLWEKTKKYYYQELNKLTKFIEYIRVRSWQFIIKVRQILSHLCVSDLVAKLVQFEHLKKTTEDRLP